jgi:hypothetical protein
MNAKTYDNTKAYSVTCTALVGKGKTLAQDFFQTRITVKSPKTGRVLTDVRVDYLNTDSIYQFEVTGPVNGNPTFEKILQGFESPVSRKAGVTKYHDEVTAVCELTAHDLHCIQLAWSGWQARQEDYAD